MNKTELAQATGLLAFQSSKYNPPKAAKLMSTDLWTLHKGSWNSKRSFRVAGATETRCLENSYRDTGYPVLLADPQGYRTKDQHAAITKALAESTLTMADLLDE